MKNSCASPIPSPCGKNEAKVFIPHLFNSCKHVHATNICRIIYICKTDPKFTFIDCHPKHFLLCFQSYFASTDELSSPPRNKSNGIPLTSPILTYAKASAATASVTNHHDDDDVAKGIITALNSTPALLDEDSANFKHRLIDKVSSLVESNKTHPIAYFEHLTSFLNGKISLRSTVDAKAVLYVYLPHNRFSIDEDEYNDQKQAHERFFRVGKREIRTGQPADDLYRRIIKRKEGDVFELDGLSARSVVIALAKVISKHGCFPTKLKFKIGDSVLTCKGADEKRRKHQIANFWLSVDQLRGEHYAYYYYDSSNEEGGSKSVGNKLSAMIWNKRAERESQLARLLTLKSVKIESFYEHEFNQFTRIALDGEPRVDSVQKESLRKERRELISKHIHYLNGLNFLSTIAEVTRRLYRNSETGEMYDYGDARARRSDAVPVGVFQARSRRLLSQGNISINDVFGCGSGGGRASTGSSGGGPTELDDSNDAFIYHTGGQYRIAASRGTVDNADEIEFKAKTINTKVESDLLFPSINKRLFQPAAVFDVLSLTPENMRCAAGKNLTRAELGEIFGGDCESEGEDYSDRE